jgi:hypothetical protein
MKHDTLRHFQRFHEKISDRAFANRSHRVKRKEIKSRDIELSFDQYRTHDLRSQLDEVSRLTNQRNNFRIIVFKFFKLFMIRCSDSVLFYSRSYLLQSFVYCLLSLSYVVRKLSLNHISRSLNHFLAFVNDQHQILSIVRLNREWVNDDHSDEARRRDREDRSQSVSKSEKNSNWD